MTGFNEKDYTDMETEESVSRKAGRPKGTPKTGGRQKGTPNRITNDVRTWLAELISENRRQIEADLKELEPKDRVMMLEKLMQYVIPKKQAIKAEIEDLSDDDVAEVADRILTELRNNGD